MQRGFHVRVTSLLVCLSEGDTTVCLREIRSFLNTSETKGYSKRFVKPVLNTTCPRVNITQGVRFETKSGHCNATKAITLTIISQLISALKVGFAIDQKE